MFEAIEHIEDIDSVLEEAKRVARKKMFITVPNCSGFEKLKRLHLTYDHFLAIDHINFFTKKDLEDLLSKHFKKFKVEGKEPINTVLSPWWLRKMASFLYKLKLLRPSIYCRLYAVVNLEKGNE